MAAPVIHSRNDFQVAADADSSYNFSLTNAPQTGGVVVVCAAVFTGNSAGIATTLTATGGSGITVTERASDIPTNNTAFGVAIWTVDYTTAPTSLTILRSAGTGDFYASGSALNITGQTGSYFDVAGVSSGTSTSPVATAMGDLTDSTDLVIGIVGIEDVGHTITPNGSWTEVVEIDEGQTTYVPANIIQRTPGATGTYDPTWSVNTSSTWHAAGIAIKGTAGGGAQLTSKNGIAISTMSAFNGIAKASVASINGLTI